MKIISSIKLLGFCGILSSIFSSIAGYYKIPIFLGIGSTIMLIGNLYAVFSKEIQK